VTQAPADLGIDLMSGTFYEREPYDAYAWMRANAPVYYDEPNDLWAVASYAGVKAASVDTESFSNAGGIRPKNGPLPMMIDFDAPEHVRRRRLVSEGFTPRRVRAMEDDLRAQCDAIIDEVCEKGSCDLVRDIAAPLPIIVIGNLLGVAPTDRDDLLRWSDDMLKALGSPDPAMMEGAANAFMEYTAYIHPVFEDRRSRGSIDDLVGVRFSHNAGLVSMVVQNRCPLPYRGEYEAGHKVVLSKRLPWPAHPSLLVLPLVLHERALGTLILGAKRRHAFGDPVRPTLEVLASHLAVSLSNARMVQKLETMATTDGLTGLFNKRAMLESAAQKIAPSTSSVASPGTNEGSTRSTGTPSSSWCSRRRSSSARPASLVARKR